MAIVCIASLCGWIALFLAIFLSGSIWIGIAAFFSVAAIAVVALLLFYTRKDSSQRPKRHFKPERHK